MTSDEVFVLGSGFSKWINPRMPSLSDLSSIVADHEVGKRLDPNLRKILQQAGFEVLISYLYGNYPWKEEWEVSLHRSIYLQIVQVLTDTILAKQTDALAAPHANASRIAKYWKQMRSHIVTFKCDTIVESISEVIDWSECWQQPVRDVLSRTGGGGLGNALIESGPTITKLHGSVNWLVPRDSPASGDVFWYNPRATNDPVLLKGLKPLIVPPTLKKSLFLQSQFLSMVWQTARVHLGSARRVFVVGYSLPPSDAYVELLFGSSMLNAEEVVIVNTDDSPRFLERCRELFGKYGIRADLGYVGKGDPVSQLVADMTSGTFK